MIDAYVVSYPHKETKKILNFINKKINFSTLKKAKLIIVVGGDGFMLQILKKFYKHKKPFYGINSGDYGFLMNKFSPKNFIQDLKRSKSISISPLEMKVKNKFNKVKKGIAINEVSILRQTRQAASVSIKIGSKYLIKKLRGDGVLVSTPAGSTAYNLSVHGPILNLDSKKLSISPVSPFRPRRWKSRTVSDKSKIEIKNLNPVKRPMMAVADNIEIKNTVNIKISINSKIIFKILYSKKNSLDKKIKIEQLKKETL